MSARDLVGRFRCGGVKHERAPRVCSNALTNCKVRLEILCMQYLAVRTQIELFALTSGVQSLPTGCVTELFLGERSFA